MEKLKIKNRNRPEGKIQDEIVSLLRTKEWFVKETHGNMYQEGFPDIYATHRKYGQRWIEVKLPRMKGSQWTEAQKKYFPLFMANGAGIWVLTAASNEEYQKLFERPNYGFYLVGLY